MVSPRARSFKREEIFFHGCNLSNFALESLLLIPPYNNIEQGYDTIIIRVNLIIW